MNATDIDMSEFAVETKTLGTDFDWDTNSSYFDCIFLWPLKGMLRECLTVTTFLALHIVFAFVTHEDCESLWVATVGNGSGSLLQGGIKWV
jgi:hypothetical protein